MNKTSLIIKREYLTRVRKRTFIIGTILFPVLYLLLIFGTGYIAAKNKKDLKVAIIDRSGLFTDSLINKINTGDSANQLSLMKSETPTFKDSFDVQGYSGYINIPATINYESGDRLVLVTKKTYGLGAAEPIENKLNQIWNEIKYKKLGIGLKENMILNGSKLRLVTENLKDKNANQGTATVIGYVCAILMYMILLIYGSQVMMGVTEEKTNRIAEVVISSVKPFQLMIGKIVGIGMVALTQFLIWIACIFVIYYIGKGTSNSSGMMMGAMENIQKAFTTVNIPLVIGCFIFYLLAGFFFYAALYAAIGSAINEDMREAQSLSFPITMLIIFSISLMSTAISDPTGGVAFWASIIPFSAPIVMMARIPFGVPNTVPWWELGLSMVVLMAGFLLTTWLASRIYRTGILMYGKKASWKEMLKWAFRKA